MIVEGRALKEEDNTHTMTPRQQHNWCITSNTEYCLKKFKETSVSKVCGVSKS